MGIAFSIPNTPSFSSTTPDSGTSVKLGDGTTTSHILFVPDTKYLTKFAQGDLGIADSMKRSMILKNIAKMDNLSQLEIFTKSSGAQLSKPLESYIRNGKVQVNPNDLTLTNVDGDLGGLKAMEKAMFQSIFETQKPYMEVIKMTTESLVKIEDIIAMVLGVAGSSKKPKGNPRALGYQGNTKLKEELFKLESLSKTNTGPKSPSTTNSIELSSVPDGKTNGNLYNFGYVTQSIVYSTGKFDPNVEYTYIYKDIKDDTIILPDYKNEDKSDDIDSDKPSTIIFGVYDKDWNKVPDQLVEEKLGWIKRSGKWFGSFDQIVENKDFSYEKVNINGVEKIIYYNDDGPSIQIDGDTKYIKNGFPKIKQPSITSLLSYYKNYYLDDAELKMKKQGMSQSMIDSTKSNISSILDKKDNYGTTGIQTTIEACLKGGFLSKTNMSNTPGIIDDKFKNAKHPYKPKKVSYRGNSIWIDPESKYDMKIIKCDSSKDIKFFETESSKKSISTNIVRFVSDSIEIKLSNNESFIYSIKTKASVDFPKSGTTNNIIIDNHDTTNSYTVSIYQKSVPSEFKNGITWTDTFGKWEFNSNNGNYKLVPPINKSSNYSIVFPGGKKLNFNSDNTYINTEVYNGNISNLLPLKFERNIVVIDIDTFKLSQNRSVLPPNQIKVVDSSNRFGRIISANQIKNEHLSVSTPLSKEKYGTPSEGNQSISQVYRYMQNIDDIGTYYIVEGVLSSKNKQKIISDSDSDQNGGSGSYNFLDVIGVFPAFIELTIDIYSKLIPSISNLITMIKNPPKVVTDIIISKLGDNSGSEPEKFGFYSKDFINDMKNLSKINDDDLEENIRKKEKFIDESKLKNYVYVDPRGNTSFLLDGLAVIGLFGDSPLLKDIPGLKFGIETKIGTLSTKSPETPFNLIFNGPSPSTKSAKNDLSGLSSGSNLKSLDINKIKGTIGENIDETVTIQYSTGVYRSDVNYTYIYVTEEINSLLKDAQELENTGDIPKSIKKLEQALDKDPNNQFIKDKLDSLRKSISNSSSNPILDFILNIVTLPLKVIFGIISYILDFFKSLFNPFELIGKVIDFISFKWMADLLNPTSKNSMFAMAGILFDIPTFLAIWLPSISSGTMDSYDLNKIIKLPWISGLPTYNREQFKSLIYGHKRGTPILLPLDMLFSVLWLIEGVVNGFIDFIWGLLGLGCLIPPPHIKLRRDTNNDISAKDMMDLLNGKYFDDSANVNASSTSYNFVYDIKTTDGRNIKELNQIDLDKWMEENKDLQFIFNLS